MRLRIGMKKEYPQITQMTQIKPKMCEDTFLSFFLKSVQHINAGIPNNLILCFLAMIVLFYGGVAWAETTNPLAHRMDAVIIKGHKIPSPFLGGEIDSYRVFSCSGSTFTVIPFQIDEYDQEGNNLFKQGPEAKAGDGVFSRHDELVFMARDAGTSRGGQAPSGCEKAASISLTDSEREAQGFVLLALCEKPPAPSSKDYVDMDIENRTVSTKSYGFGWQKAPVYYYDYLTMGGGADILDRIKVRCSIGKWGMTYTFSEEDFHTRFIGYTDGPVRVLWQADNYWSLGPFGKIPSPQSIAFYPDYIVDHNDLDMTINPAVLGLDFILLIGHDMHLDNARHSKLCANILPECLAISEHMPGIINFGERREIEWGGISGPDGAMITRLVKDARLAAPVEYVFVYDPSQEDQREYIKGSSPMIGFEFSDWRDVKSEVYDLVLYHFFMGKYSVDGLSQFNRIIDDPLMVSLE